jgi:hypothetical protein
MIELVWRAHGRFAIEEESARETTVDVNQATRAATRRMIAAPHRRGRGWPSRAPT